MNHQQVYVRETNREVLICLDKNMPDALAALEEAARILRVEVLHAKTNLADGDPRKSSSHVVPRG